MTDEDMGELLDSLLKEKEETEESAVDPIVSKEPNPMIIIEFVDQKPIVEIREWTKINRRMIERGYREVSRTKMRMRRDVLREDRISKQKKEREDSNAT